MPRSGGSLTLVEVSARTCVSLLWSLLQHVALISLLFTVLIRFRVLFPTTFRRRSPPGLVDWGRVVGEHVGMLQAAMPPHLLPDAIDRRLVEERQRRGRTVAAAQQVPSISLARFIEGTDEGKASVAR